MCFYSTEQCTPQPPPHPVPTLLARTVRCLQEINDTLWALGNSTEVPQRLLQQGVAPGTVQAVRDAVRALSGVLYSSECQLNNTMALGCYTQISAR